MARNALLLLSLLPFAALAAPVQAPVVKDSAGRSIQAQPTIAVDESGTYVSGGSTGTVTANPPSSATSSTPTTVPFTTTSTLLLAANPLRLGCTIVNDTTAVLLLKGSTPASSTSYQWPIDAKTTIAGSYECPYGWKGPVYGIWIGTGTGNAIVTERTQ